MDQITNIVKVSGGSSGWKNSDNVSGIITEFDMQSCLNDPNFIIRHVIPITISGYVGGVFSSTGQIVWPLVFGDAPGQGNVPEGIILCIPSSATMPTGQTRAFKALWDIFQRFGGFINNVTSAGQIATHAQPESSATQTFADAMSSAFGSIVPHLGYLDYTPGASGAQYSLDTLKGKRAGAAWSDAFPAPPLLDFTPTGGVSVKPDTFGAWTAANGLGLTYDVNWESTITLP
jgi:hypothetical protein